VSSKAGSAIREQGRASASQVDETRRSMLAKLGLAAGCVGLLAAPDSAQAATTHFDDTVEVVPPAGNMGLKVVCAGDVPESASVGGALNLDNTASTGAGAVLYSDRAADALGRLLVVNQSNPANPQHAVRIQNAGTAHTVSIFHDPAGGAGDPTAEAVDIVSTNALDTALGVRGREVGKGTVKITHGHPGVADDNAAALSIALEGAGTACQGIFIGNDADNPTTGDLLHIRNGGAGKDRLRLTADGLLEIADALKLTNAAKVVTDARYVAACVPAATTITLNSGGGLRGLAVSAAISTSGTLDPTSLQMLNVNSAVTPAATTNMRNVEVYKSNLTLRGLPGAADGVIGSVFSSFQHQLRLDPIPSGGSGHFTSVFGFYASPITTVGAGWAVNNYSLLRVEAPGGSGAILNLTGVEIRDFRARAMFNYSMRSFGPGMHMRHSGGVNLGSQATPDTILHLRGNPSFHGSVTLDQESGDPPAPAPGAQARLYVKSGKLVVQWNDGSKTLFTTIPLNAPGPYPVSTQVTTDTVAP